ncbi:MAG: hypothetical protein K2M59_02655 [Muribaculaceae bacterium]|nr:hypothetical protein [Muribaculaceae bacterium]
MKKIYTLALAALMAAGVSAADKKESAVGTIKTSTVEAQSMMSRVEGSVVSSGFKDMAEVAGTYTWSFSPLLNNLTSPKTLTFEVSDATTGTVNITGWVNGQNFVVKGTVDLVKNTVTIANKQYLGKDSGGDENYFYLKGADASGKILDGASDQATTVGTISDNVVTFPSMDIWAIGDYNKESIGYWTMSYRNVITVPEPETPVDEVEEGKWDVIGEAELIDGWITCGYKRGGEPINPADYPITCELQQNKENKNVYRLWRPYHMAGWTLAANNESTRDGQIVFDVTDPKHVIVKAGKYAGFKNNNGDFAVFGGLGWQVWMSGEKDGETVSQSELESIYTFMEGKGYPFDTFDADKKVVTVNKSNFDFNITCEKCYSWTDPITYVSTITFKTNESGISEVGADQNEVKYFNLQGMEVSAPQAGELVIRKEGSKVSKVIVK